MNDNQQISEGNTLALPSDSFNDTYIWMVNNKEVEALTLTSKFIFYEEYI